MSSLSVCQLEVLALAQAPQKSSSLKTALQTVVAAAEEQSLICPQPLTAGFAVIARIQQNPLGFICPDSSLSEAHVLGIATLSLEIYSCGS